MANPDGLMNQGAAAKKYHPILEIGSGGMSRVYLTVVRGPAGFNKFQVVKRLLPSLANDPEFLNMFLEEARLSARLNHANVVQINEVGFDGEHHFMAMEYLEGQSLESVVRRAARHAQGVPLLLHLRVLAEAAAGLHYAHEFADIDGRPLNVVHRDVSPHNVFVTYQGQIKVLDFGIAKAADSSLHTRTGMLKGKVAYMAPEQLRRSGAPDRRADIFALGVMLWQAVAGRRLWQDMSDLEVFQEMNARRIPSLRDCAPGAPPALVQICERALAYDRDYRFSTAAEFGDALEGFMLAGGYRVTSRELGAFVSELFAAKRAEVQSLIESALSRRPADTDQISLVPPHTGQLAAVPRESSPTGQVAFGQSVDRWQSNGVADPVRSLSPEAMRSGLPDGQIAAPPGRGRLWLLVSALALGLSASVTTYIVITRTPLQPAPQPAALASTGSSAPTAPVVPADGAKGEPQKRIRLTVKAVPSNARLFVDDVPLSSNPGSANFARDGLGHHVRAEAPGFATDAKTVVYNVDEETVSFHLQRESHRGAATWHPPAGKTSTTAAAPPITPAEPPPKPPANTATGKAFPPPLDRENPWAP